MPKGKSNDGKTIDDERLIVPYSHSTVDGVDTVTMFYHQGISPLCVRHSLASVFSYKGLHRPEKFLTNCSSAEDYSLIRVNQLLQKQGGNPNPNHMILNIY